MIQPLLVAIDSRRGCGGVRLEVLWPWLASTAVEDAGIEFSFGFGKTHECSPSTRVFAGEGRAALEARRCLDSHGGLGVRRIGSGGGLKSHDPRRR